MKKHILLLFFTSLFALNACFQDIDFWTDYSNYKPIYMKRSEMNSQIKLLTSHPLLNPAKIYVSGNYIFINEKYKGIHIIDNSNPAAPLNIAYVQLPGNIDFAVKNGFIYADNGPDLVTLKIGTSFSSLTVSSRIENALPAIPIPDGLPLEPRYTGSNVPTDAILIGFESK